MGLIKNMVTGPYFENMIPIYSIFGVKMELLYLAKKKGNDMAHLENILLNLGIFLKHDSRAKDQMAII